MGLNDVYARARGNILMINPLPGLDYAYSLLLQDESLRETYVNAQIFTDSTSFMVTNQGKPNQKPRISFSKMEVKHQNLETIHRGLEVHNRGSKKRRSSLILM